MELRLSSKAAAAIIVLLGCGALPGCHDGEALPTLANLWPNVDGSSWSHDYTARVWDFPSDPTLYATPADVPPPPTMQELVQILRTHAIDTSWQTEETTYTLTFQGTITTESGATGQYLVEDLDPLVPPARTGTGNRPPETFLAQLWKARPDLRERLRAEGLAPPREARRSNPTFVPLFLSGYAWTRGQDWIGGYGDLDRNPAWKYLTAGLAPGSEFTHQLVPAIADDIFLHARILPRQTVETPLGTFEDVVTCLYLVDYGIGSGINDTGMSGYAQAVSYGTVAYAPGVGPVFSYERVLPYTEGPLSLGLGDITLRLAARTVPGS